MHSNRAQTPALPAVLLVGAGRVGRSLRRALGEAGIDARLAGRDELHEAGAEAELALLCVPDAQIPAAAAALAGVAPQLRFVGHTSGASGLGELRAATEHGAAAFSLHPLQTLPDGDADLLGAPAAIAGSGPDALALARRLAEAIGMRPFEVPEHSRPAYHAAATVAANFLVALEESAVELLADAGIEGGRELLAPLVLRSAANWVECGAEALTGPIARGDGETVRRHVEAVAATSPGLSELYRVLAERTRELAADRQGVGA